MKRTILKAFFVGALAIALLGSGCSRQPQVLLYVRDGSSDFEYMFSREFEVMKSMLEDAGFRVVVATSTEESYYRLRATLNPDVALKDVRVSKYSGFLLPCMAAGAPGIIEAEAVDMVKQAAAQGKPVAAQYGAVFILARAGLLNGKQYAFGYETSTIKDGIFGGTGVVQDGQVITSGTCPYQARITGRPDGTAELTQKLIEAVK
jgi:putative intracellular protease/amidase